MARRKNDNAWTPNQIVAYRIHEARRMRGWTQEQAAAELEPYLGSKLDGQLLRHRALVRRRPHPSVQRR